MGKDVQRGDVCGLRVAHDCSESVESFGRDDGLLLRLP